MATKTRKAKTDTAAPMTLDDRVAMFFRTLPYGQPAGLGELSLDLGEKELARLIPKEECDSILKRMETDGFELPKSQGDRLATARTKAVDQSVDRLCRDGVITRIKMDDPGQVGMGYYFSGERPPEDVPGERTEVPIDRIKVDAKNFQARAKGLNTGVVDKYSAVADRLPPVDVWDVGEDRLHLTRGFHRIEAFKRAGFDVIPVVIHRGTKEQAKLHALSDNATHGYARTLDDIKAAVAMFLQLPGNRDASVASVADAVKCAWATADKAVKFWRKAWGQEQKTKGGGERQADTGEAPPETPAPDASAPAPDVATGAEGTAGPTVKDRLGNPVTDEAVAKAFADKRLSDAISNIYSNMEFIRNLRSDGYAQSALPVKDRAGVLNDMEYQLDTIRQSLPYCVCPADAGTADAKLKAAVRRGWMTQEEWKDYQTATAKPVPFDKSAENLSPESPAAETPAAETPATAEGPADATPAA